MADQAIAGAIGQLKGAVLGGSTASVSGIGTSWIIGIALFVGIAVISIVGAFIWFYFSERKKWNISVRVYYENPTINGISFASIVPAKRVRFKDGKVAYLYKTPIQGYTVSPELLTWTRQKEHDIVITQDKKLFCINGINSIDAQRKLLNVDVSHPDIEMDRQDLQKHIDSKKFDDPNERFKMILKIATYIFVGIVIIVLVVLGSKTYIDAKNIDLQRDSTNLRTAQLQESAMNNINTFVLILSKVMPESFRQIDGQNLLNQTLR